jgi:hypothetical protein
MILRQGCEKYNKQAGCNLEINFTYQHLVQKASVIYSEYFLLGINVFQPVKAGDASELTALRVVGLCTHIS